MNIFNPNSKVIEYLFRNIPMNPFTQENSHRRFPVIYLSHRDDKRKSKKIPRQKRELSSPSLSKSQATRSISTLSPFLISENQNTIRLTNREIRKSS